ncbi:MAG TPA: c-type cytochrome [Anaerolineaceae bacterium]
MKRNGLIWLFSIIIIAALSLVVAIQPAQATSPGQTQKTSLPRGAALYDDWAAVVGKNPPAGNMPLWGTQKTNTRSGADTYRCVSCHGWDYAGKDGAYRPGTSFYTGFPGISTATRSAKPEEIVALLKGSKNKDHNFSAWIDDSSLLDLAEFIKNGVIDDREYIDPVTLEVKGGSAANGKTLYDKSCASCHGSDGKKLPFRFEGRDAYLGDLADLDPWRFLHKTRFGTPGTKMVIGYDLGWTAQEGRDVLLYAQSLPGRLERAAAPPVLEGRNITPEASRGGPASSVWTGILTALGAIATGLGFALLVGGVLVGIIFVIVWVIRGRNR